MKTLHLHWLQQQIAKHLLWVVVMAIGIVVMASVFQKVISAMDLQSLVMQVGDQTVLMVQMKY